MNAQHFRKLHYLKSLEENYVSCFLPLAHSFFGNDERKRDSDGAAYYETKEVVRITFEYLTPLRSLLHFPQEYLLSSMSSSAEKNAARQSVSETDGPQTHE